MHTKVDILLPDGSTASLGHGGIIGRLQTASVCIPDPRVSEAHAMVSLRGHSACLLGLRGRFFVDGHTRTSVDLMPGMEVHLARDLSLRVLEVHIPDHVLAVRSAGMPQQTLLGLTSLYANPPRIEPGWSADADEVLWPADDHWVRGSDDSPVAPGPVAVGSAEFELVLVPTTGVLETHVGTGFRVPLTLECFHDTVHVHRGGRVEITFSGMNARLLSELVTLEKPVSWDALARVLWGDLSSSMLRKRWDMQLYRLRRVLREHQVRTGLIRSDGTGLVELVLDKGDTAIDRS